MPGIGHLACGLAAGRLESGSVASRAVFYAGVSLLPDLDVLAFACGVPYSAPFGHRGAMHSFAFAAAVGLAVGLLSAATGAIARRAGRERERRSSLRFGATVAALLSIHVLLDALTDGGLGVAMLWPWSSERIFLPWQPIPVAPIGLGVLSARGALVAGVELAMFSPLFLYALWPRRKRASAPASHGTREPSLPGS